MSQCYVITILLRIESVPTPEEEVVVRALHSGTNLVRIRLRATLTKCQLPTSERHFVSVIVSLTYLMSPFINFALCCVSRWIVYNRKLVVIWSIISSNCVRTARSFRQTHLHNGRFEKATHCFGLQYRSAEEVERERQSPARHTASS